MQHSRAYYTTIVELDVGPAAIWQPDFLAQRSLYRSYTRSTFPDYHSIEVKYHDVGNTRLVYDYYPAQKHCFDDTLGPDVQAETRASLWELIVSTDGYANRVINVCHEAQADHRAIAQLQQPSRQQKLVLTIHDICTELGVANSHDTSVFVKQSRLEERKIPLKRHLDNLASLMREVKINRKRGAGEVKDQQFTVKLADNISSYFKAFSGYELKGEVDVPQQKPTKYNPEGAKRRYKYKLEAIFPYMPEMIQAVTLRNNLPETVPASQSILEQPDYAEDGCDSGDLSLDEEDSLQEQTCRKRIKELKIM